MDFLQTLEAHRGGLIRIKSELFWYGSVGWDGAQGRVFLLLDTTTTLATATVAAGLHAPHARTRADFAAATVAAGLDAPHARTGLGVDAAAFVLIDGAPHWVWVCQEDVEIL